MIRAIERFARRLSVPQSTACPFTFKVTRCIENVDDTLDKRFGAARDSGKHRILQLYHAVRQENDWHGICREGFRMGSYGNKGPGVYFANHARYSWHWATTACPVLICDVIADPEFVKRFKSEIYSPTWDSEYVVSNPSLIYPKYILSYTVSGGDYRKFDKLAGYVKLGEFGCHSCDTYGNPRFTLTGKRCDCEQYPLVDDRDVID